MPGDVRADLLAVRRVGAMALARLHHIREPPLYPLLKRLTPGVEYDPARRVSPRLGELPLDLFVLPCRSSPYA
jgi:hypothetical protein